MSGGNSGVESLPSKQMVAGSNPVPRSICWSVQDGFETVGHETDSLFIQRGIRRAVLMRG